MFGVIIYNYMIVVDCCSRETFSQVTPVVKQSVENRDRKRSRESLIA